MNQLLSMGRQGLFPVPECPLLAVGRSRVRDQDGTEKMNLGPEGAGIELNPFSPPPVLRGH